MWYWSFTYVVLEFHLCGTGNETKSLFKEAKSLGLLSLGYRKNFELSF